MKLRLGLPDEATTWEEQKQSFLKEKLATIHHRTGSVLVFLAVD